MQVFKTNAINTLSYGKSPVYISSKLGPVPGRDRHHKTPRQNYHS